MHIMQIIVKIMALLCMFFHMLFDMYCILYSIAYYTDLLTRWNILLCTLFCFMLPHEAVWIQLNPSGYLDITMAKEHKSSGSFSSQCVYEEDWLRWGSSHWLSLWLGRYKFNFCHARRQKRAFVPLPGISRLMKLAWLRICLMKLAWLRIFHIFICKFAFYIDLHLMCIMHIVVQIVHSFTFYSIFFVFNCILPISWETASSPKRPRAFRVIGHYRGPGRAIGRSQIQGDSKRFGIQNNRISPA